MCSSSLILSSFPTTKSLIPSPLSFSSTIAIWLLKNFGCFLWRVFSFSWILLTPKILVLRMISRLTLRREFFCTKNFIITASPEVIIRRRANTNSHIRRKWIICPKSLCIRSITWSPLRKKVVTGIIASRRKEIFIGCTLAFKITWSFCDNRRELFRRLNS